MMGFEARFSLTGFLQVQARTRFSIWDLIGNVGGFNDGVFLFCSFFMGSFASNSFAVNYLNSQYVEGANNPNDPKSRGQIHPKPPRDDPQEDLFPNLTKG